MLSMFEGITEDEISVFKNVFILHRTWLSRYHIYKNFIKYNEILKIEDSLA